MRRRQLVLAGLLVLIAVSLAGPVFFPREPDYLGHPISYWIEPWWHHGTEPPEREDAAYAEMDGRAR